MEYKITVMKNAFYAQSGGVTSVINCSAYGVISKFKKDFSENSTSKLFNPKYKLKLFKKS